MGFFTTSELQSVLTHPSDPSTQVASLYTHDRSAFIADLGSEFSSLTEDQYKAAFVTVLAHELKPYGGNTSTTLDGLLTSTTGLHCGNYSQLTLYLYAMLSPTADANIQMIGWDSGSLTAHSEIVMSNTGATPLLLDPTLGLIALTTGGFNGLVAGDPIPPAHIASFFDPSVHALNGANLQPFDTLVTAAMTQGLFRTGELGYWFERANYPAYYGSTATTPDPQSSTIGGHPPGTHFDLGSAVLGNRLTGSATTLVGSYGSDHITGTTAALIMGGVQTFTGSNYSDHGLTGRSSAFFTGGELTEIRNDPNSITSLYAADRSAFIGALNSSFRSLPEDELKLAFASMLAFQLQPLGSHTESSLSDLLSAPDLDDTSHSVLAWRLFDILSPSSTADLNMQRWDGGAIAENTQLLMSVQGSPALLVDPTLGTLATVISFNSLTAGEAIPISHQQSFAFNSDNQDMRDQVITAQTEGLYRGGDLAAWFESPDSPANFADYYSRGYHWGSPEGDVLLAGGDVPTALGGTTSEDILTGVAGSVLVGDGVVNSAGVWTSASSLGGLWAVGDFNGDGKSDIMNYSVTGGIGATDVFLSSGTHFVGGNSWTSAVHSTDSWLVGDFNGDGKSDILAYISGVGNEVYLSNGTSFTSAGSWSGFGHGSLGWYTGDFNGDGKTDLLRYVAGVGSQVFLSTGSGFTYDGTWTVAGFGRDGWVTGDFNGDGKTDLMRYSTTQGTQVLLSTGSGFTYGGEWTTLSPGAHSWTAADVNGDGKTDLIGNVYGTTSGSVVLDSTGSGFENDTSSGSANWTPLNSNSNYALGDFNGDGMSDFLQYTKGTAGATALLTAGLDHHDNDSFMFTPTSLQGSTIADFQGAGAVGGDSIWFSGFGSASQCHLTNSGDHWTITNTSLHISDTFRIVGVTHLGHDDYFFA